MARRASIQPAKSKPTGEDLFSWATGSKATYFWPLRRAAANYDAGPSFPVVLPSSFLRRLAPVDVYPVPTPAVNYGTACDGATYLHAVIWPYFRIPDCIAHLHDEYLYVFILPIHNLLENK